MKRIVSWMLAGLVAAALAGCSQSVSVTYKPNGADGGTVPTDANSYKEGETLTVLDSGTLSRVGHTFSGWNTAPDEGGIDYPVGSVHTLSSYDAQHDIYLYPVWTPNSYRVIYDGNGSDGGTAPADATEYAEGAEVTAVLPGTIRRAGNVFAGWNTAPDGSGTEHSAGTTLSMPAQDVTLYAGWDRAPTSFAGNLEKQLSLKRSAIEHPRPYRLRFVPHSRKLIGIDLAENKVVTWNVDSGEVVKSTETFKNLQPHVLDVALDGRYIVVASDEFEARILDAVNGATVWIDSDSAGWVEGALFHHSGSLIVATREHKSLRFYEPTADSRWYLRDRISGDYFAIAFAQWSEKIVAKGIYSGGDRDEGGVHMFTPNPGTYKQRGLSYDSKLAEDDRYFRGVVGSTSHPLGGTVVFSRWRGDDQGDSLVVLGHGPDGWNTWHTLDGHKDAISSIQPTLDGDHVLTGGADREIRVWNVRQGELVQTIAMDGPVVEIAYSADGKYLAAGTQDGTIIVWRVVGPWGAAHAPAKASSSEASSVSAPDASAVVEAVLNDSDVRVRTKPTSEGSRVVGNLAKGDVVYILGKSKNEEKIGNMSAHWYKIETKDGMAGYSYGYFFDVDQDKLKAVPEY